MTFDLDTTNPALADAIAHWRPELAKPLISQLYAEMHVIKARLVEMVAYAECLENELDEKACISQEELRSYFNMEDQLFNTEDLKV